MAEATIDSLKLEISSSSSGASKGLNALTRSLKKLQTATSKGLGLGAVVTEIKQANSSVKSSSLDGLNKAIETLTKLSGVKISPSIGNQIKAISTSLNTADFSGGRAKIEELVTALKPLEDIGRTNLTSTVNALKKLPEALDKLDTRTLYTKIQSLTRIFKPLADEMQKVANGFSVFPTKIQKLIASSEKLSLSNQKTSTSFINLYAKLRMAWVAVARVAKAIGKCITLSSDYTETMNLFTVSMGQYAEAAYNYAQTVGDAMGIDPAEWMKHQGVFMTLTKGFGVAGDRADVMSQQLTQLGYDLSSFFNISVEDAMTKLESGIAGELEPLRRLGYDLSQAKLEATALSLGIDKAVASMTQAEKAELRYYAIMTQVTDAHNDMARTLDAPANQMRILNAQVTQLGRALGNFFIPLLNKVLPSIIASVKVLRGLLDVFMDLLGIELAEVDFSKGSITSATDDIVSNLEDGQKEAKKLKSYMLGFDELNVLNVDDGSDDLSELLGSGFDFELPTYDFMDGIVATQVDDIVKKMKEWLGITEEIESWSDLLATNFGNIAVAVAIVGIGLAAWKISKLLKNVSKLKTAFTGISVFFKAMGIAAVSLAAIAGASWLINNTEDTMTKIGAILSAGALVVGSILAFTGVNLPLGIGLMAVGAVSMGTAIAMNTSKLNKEMKNVVAAISATVSGALLVTGAVLAFSGVNIPLGIALMAGGALTLGTAIAPNWNSLSDEVQTVITSIMGVVGGALLALGAILAFSGVNIPLGIGLMATGALSLGGAIALNWEKMEGDLESTVSTITTIVSGASLGLGAVLAFTGANIPLGIGLMAVGAVGLASQIAMNTDALPDEVKDVVAVITTVVSEAMLAVGAILAFSGVNIPLGIALLAGGALAMGASVIPNWDSLSKNVRNTISKIMVIVGGALLAVGALLAFTGVGIPLGIGLMLVGAASLGTAVALNWNSIVTSMQGTLGKVLAIIGAASMVIGAILLFTGVGIPLGLGLLLGGAASLGTAVAFNWSAITNKVKEICNTIKETVSGMWTKVKNGGKAAWEGIKSVFSSVGTFFKDTFTNAWEAVKKVFSTGGKIFDGIKDGIVSAFKAIVNGIIKGINKVVSAPFNGINAALEKIRDIDILGVEPFKNLKTVSVPQIPLLAQGGFPEMGQMFIAREAGAELVGNIGGRTAVMNNDQIVESVSAGVYQAVLAALGSNTDDGGNTNIVINLDGEKIYENQQKIARGRGYNLGMGAFSFG